MPWVRLDDNFPDHRKIAELGDYAPVAGWLFICGLAYCNRQLTDGFIPKQHVIRLASFRHLGIETAGVKGLVSMGEDIEADTLAELLEAVGLWEDRDTHWYIHDYPDYQPTKAEVEAEREQKRAAGRAGGLASGRARAKAGASAGGQADTQAKTKPVPVPVPTASNEAEDDAPASGRTPRPRKRNIQESDIARWQDEHPEWDIPAFVADYLNWSGSSRHSDKVQGFENQMRIEWKCKQFTRAGAGPPPRVITFDDDLPLPEGMALPEVRFQR